MFSDQNGFCQVCGLPFKWNANSSFEQRVCSKPCWIEYKWRETLSILGKPYRKDERICPNCKGHGWIGKDICSRCDMRGILEKETSKC